MNINEIEMKQKFAEKYLYLQKNAKYILAPYMNKETMALNPLNLTTLIQLEEILFSNKELEKNTLFKFIEYKKKEKKYMEFVEEGLKIIKQKNMKYNNSHQVFKYKLDVIKILIAVRRHIEDQSEDLENKKNKLQVLDQYFKVSQYHNVDPEILYRYKNNQELNLYKNSHNDRPSRKKHDIGVTTNSFIKAFSGNNAIKLTDDEIQRIYLITHDELPWNLETTCKKDSLTKKPNLTIPCNQPFHIKEEEIFIQEENYFQLCPHCGYMVNIPENMLSNKIKTRIKNHCIEDPYFPRKMFLLSELTRLEKISSNKKNTKIRKLER